MGTSPGGLTLDPPHKISKAMSRNCNYWNKVNYSARIKSNAKLCIGEKLTKVEDSLK